MCFFPFFWDLWWPLYLPYLPTHPLLQPRTIPPLRTYLAVHSPHHDVGTWPAHDATMTTHTQAHWTAPIQTNTPTHARTIATTDNQQPPTKTPPAGRCYINKYMRTGSQRKMKATYVRSKKKYYYCTLDCRRSQCYPIFYHGLVGLSLSVRAQCTWFSLSKNVFCPCPRH